MSVAPDHRPRLTVRPRLAAAVRSGIRSARAEAEAEHHDGPLVGPPVVNWRRRTTCTTRRLDLGDGAEKVTVELRRHGAVTRYVSTYGAPAATGELHAHAFTPRGACATFWTCRDPEVLLAGPAGTGKSRVVLERIHHVALLNPGVRILVLRKTQKSLGSTALVTWREHVVREALDAGVLWFYGGSAEHAAQYTYANGSTVTVGGLDNPDKIMSSEYDVAYIQEIIEAIERDHEQTISRLRNGRLDYQPMWADTNPSHPQHWAKQRADRGDLRMLPSRHTDNPVLYDDEGQLTPRGADYMGKLDRLTGVRLKRLKHGLWVAAEGIVYEDWDDAVHLVDPFDVPDEWPRWWGIDFGFTNAFVWQTWAEDPDGRLFLLREHVRTGMLVEDHAEVIARTIYDDPEKPDRKRAWRGTWREPKPRAIICDHDAEGRATLERELGMSTTAARKKPKGENIQAMQARMKLAGDGRPRWFVVRGAVLVRDPVMDEALLPIGLAEEITGYVWDRKDGKPPKEEPVEENNHSLDAGLYVVAHRDLGGSVRVRFLS